MVGSPSKIQKILLNSTHSVFIRSLSISLSFLSRVYNILKFLHDYLDSTIVLEEDDWVLEVYKYDPAIFRYLCKILYTLDRKERDMLEDRIKTECVEFKRIFWIFEGEPTITSEIDRWNKEPGRFYYALHNLPIPDYLKDKRPGAHQDLDWEIFSS